MNKTEIKRNFEKKIVNEMIDMYYKNDSEKANALKEYANNKIDKCPFIADKTFCSQCKIHCYDKKHRQEIRQVMRYCGPRMIFTHPILLLKHCYYSIIMR